MLTSLIRSVTAVIAMVATGLLLAACSSDNATGPSPEQVKEAAGAAAQAPTTTAATTTAETTPAETPTTQQASADGKAVFAENCAGCHTLEDAGASGQVGPNLDTLKPSDTQVETKVNAGGGSMPAFKGQLSPEEITAVSAYVASSAAG